MLPKFTFNLRNKDITVDLYFSSLQRKMIKINFLDHKFNLNLKRSLSEQR